MPDGKNRTDMSEFFAAGLYSYWKGGLSGWGLRVRKRPKPRAFSSFAAWHCQAGIDLAPVTRVTRQLIW